MQRVEGAQTPYEVYCYHCRVTFPKGTRQCIHCGSRLGQSGAVALPGAATPASGGIPPGVGGEGEDAAPMWMRRFGGLAIWGLIALSAVLSNLCQRG